VSDAFGVSVTSSMRTGRRRNERRRTHVHGRSSRQLGVELLDLPVAQQPVGGSAHSPISTSEPAPPCQHLSMRRDSGVPPRPQTPLHQDIEPHKIAARTSPVEKASTMTPTDEGEYPLNTGSAPRHEAHEHRGLTPINARRHPDPFIAATLPVGDCVLPEGPGCWAV